MNIQQAFGFASLTATVVLVSPETRAEDTSPDPYSHVYIISPQPNAFFPDDPTTLDVQLNVYQGFEDSIVDVELFVDDVSFAVQECAAGCTFVGIELAQGVHELRAVADSGSIDMATVYVAEEPPSDTGETDGTGDTGDTLADGGDEANEGGGDGGTGDGCEVADPSSPWALLALPALLLLLPGLGRSRD